MLLSTKPAQLIIEFIGTPGAGKTTLVPAAIEALQEQGIRARTVVEAARPYAQRTLPGKAVSWLTPPALHRPLLWQVFYSLSLLNRFKFFLKNPRLVRQVLAAQIRRPIPAVERQHGLHWFLHLTGCYEFLRTQARPDEALIFDEGFIHRVVQLNASDAEEPNPTQILAYVDLIPRPEVVIFVQAPQEVCRQRVYDRGIWQRFRHKSPVEISRYIANSYRVVNLAVNHIKSQGWAVIEIDNGSDDPASSKAELRRALTKIPDLAREPLALQAGQVTI